jgi:iron complex outermembrane receptor protein
VRLTGVGLLRVGWGLLTGALACAGSAQAQTLDLARLSIEELAQIEVTSVSRRAEGLDEAAASVFVLRSEDIRRSGVQTLPEALRLAPNLHVARIDALDYAIAARGLNSFESSNKLLVQIDGRNVYSPLYSGVEWDQHYVLLSDLDRIEVISGPGGALYGANAVNGVVSVFSKPAHETQGFLARAAAGTLDSTAVLRFGARAGGAGAFRVYGQAFSRGDQLRSDGREAGDGWDGGQVGFRADWRTETSTWTLQGDAFESEIDATLAGTGAAGELNGGNLLGRFEREFGERAAFSVQAYYDTYERTSRGVFDSVKTVDVEAQHAFGVGRHDIVVGAGYRRWEDQFTNFINAFTLDPPSRTVSLASAFVQDQVALTDRATLTLGLKAEESSFSGLEWMPTVRLAWRPTDASLLWGAVSRVARNPSRLERELVAPPFLVRGDFRPESLVAYELGYRGRPAERLSLSATVYLHDYDDLRSNETHPTTFFPLVIGNGVEGRTFGVEAWGDYDVSEHWRLSASVVAIDKEFRISDGSRDISGLEIGGVDPALRADLRSQWTWDAVNLDLRVRYVGDTPRGQAGGYVGADSYVEADARAAWRLSDRLELSISGFDLLDEAHPEASEARRLEVRRRFQAGLSWAW